MRSLAVFNTPTETAELVHQDYGVVVTKQQCEKYDPTKRSGENLSPELKAEFEATREAFLEKPKNIPIANLSVRLQRLEKQYEKHGKNRVAALAILKQAAEDVGGKYTNETKNSVENKTSYPSGLGHFYGRKTSNPESST